MNKKWFVFVLGILLMSFGTLHKFYVSVTSLNYDEEDQVFQVTTRIFVDDFEVLAKERYDVQLELATDREAKDVDYYVEKYLRAKLVFELDGTVVKYDYLGKKYDDDVMVCYLELPNIALETSETLTIQNEVLTELFEEQKNIVHVKWMGNKRSFVLIRDNNKGMLNLSQDLND